MFDPMLVRIICEGLRKEADPARRRYLIDTLNDVVRSDMDQEHLKLEYIASHYPEILDLLKGPPPEMPKKSA